MGTTGEYSNDSSFNGDPLIPFVTANKQRIDEKREYLWSPFRFWDCPF